MHWHWDWFEIATATATATAATPSRDTTNHMHPANSTQTPSHPTSQPTHTPPPMHPCMPHPTLLTAVPHPPTPQAHPHPEHITPPPRARPRATQRRQLTLPPYQDLHHLQLVAAYRPIQHVAVDARTKIDQQVDGGQVTRLTGTDEGGEGAPILTPTPTPGHRFHTASQNDQFLGQ